MEFHLFDSNYIFGMEIIGGQIDRYSRLIVYVDADKGFCIADGEFKYDYKSSKTFLQEWSYILISRVSLA